MTPGTADCLSQKETGRPRESTREYSANVQQAETQKMQKRSCLSSHFISIPPHAPHAPYAPHVDHTPPHTPPNVPHTPLLATHAPVSLKKPLQKSSDPHNDKVEFVIMRLLIFGGFSSRQEAMHAHGTSSVSHSGSFLKTVGGMRVV